MSAHIEQSGRPTKVAIIMDGNGRWATERGMVRVRGHAKGALRVKEIVRAAPDLGVKWLTLYAFSTENWKRSKDEVNALMSLFRRYIRNEASKLDKDGVRMRFIGERGRLDKKLLDLINWIEDRTKDNTRLNLTIALNYGGRDELARATQAIGKDVASGKVDPDDISEELIATYLDTSWMPDPELIIRTSGEFRTSNFLLWQAAYAEYSFLQSAWPDFTIEVFDQALNNFDNRDRRFGAVKTK